ncbi:hypothetical protein B0T13DRAFT_452815 [Neurospora crassa]|nr:hypothetical protein B0T13DRAFT_484433 [Neurospora crassa]KAK3504251.1 hypothetical protein B0T13DRAFT_452815 [Neurospora crassa]
MVMTAVGLCCLSTLTLKDMEHAGTLSSRQCSLDYFYRERDDVIAYWSPSPESPGVSLDLTQCGSDVPLAKAHYWCKHSSSSWSVMERCWTNCPE